MYLGSQGFHGEHVQFLTTYIFFSHVNDALQSEACTSCCSCNTVLSCTRFSNDPWFTHTKGQQRLTNGIVNFVCTRVVQIFTLEEYARALAVVRQLFC